MKNMLTIGKNFSLFWSIWREKIGTCASFLFLENKVAKRSKIKYRTQFVITTPIHELSIKNHQINAQANTVVCLTKREILSSISSLVACVSANVCCLLWRLMFLQWNRSGTCTEHLLGD